MVKTLQEKIEKFIAQSCGAYSLTTNKQIKELAVRLDKIYSNELDKFKIHKLYNIFERELTTDFDLFYEITGDLQLAQLLIDLSSEMSISLKDMYEKTNNIIIHRLSFEKFIEHKILVSKIFGDIKEEDLIYFDYEKIWEDKFSKTHYISGYACIVEFKEV